MDVCVYAGIDIEKKELCKNSYKWFLLISGRLSLFYSNLKLNIKSMAKFGKRIYYPSDRMYHKGQ